jgi:Zn-dependent M28 family amino/carboxypeptidase
MRSILFPVGTAVSHQMSNFGMGAFRVRLLVYGTLGVGLAAYGAFAAWMPGVSYNGEQRAPTPALRELEARLRKHVSALATTIGPRNVDRLGTLPAAREYLEGVLRPWTTAGAHLSLEDLEPAGEGAQNIVFEVPGKKQSIVVVGAHYDSCDVSPGANDNASGVAAALELARALAERPAPSTVRFVLFANEEPPFFKYPGMGSRTSAANAKHRGDTIVAMLALETIGFYTDAPKSQRYPWPIGLLYPSTGNFVAFVGDLGSRSLVHAAIDAFRANAAFPSEGAALPATFPGVDWSDHWSFRQAGFPAIMITDTALYRDVNYHKPTDTAAHLNYDALARVTEGVEAVVRHLAR